MDSRGHGKGLESNLPQSVGLGFKSVSIIFGDQILEK